MKGTNVKRLRYFCFIIFTLFLVFYAFYPAIYVPSYADDGVVLQQVNKVTFKLDFIHLIFQRYLGVKSFVLDSFFGGGNELHHGINIIIHIINGALLFLLLNLLTKKKTTSYCFSLLWLLHPLNSQAVIYISQRFTLVCTLFVLLSLLAMAYWRFKPSWYLVVTAILFYIAALLSKQSAVFLPLIPLIYAFLNEPKHRNKLTLFLFVAVGLVALLLYNFPNLAQMIDGLTRETQSYSRLEYFSTQLLIVFDYIKLVIYPVNLRFESDYQIVTFGSFEFYFYLFAHIAIVILAYGLSVKFANKWIFLGVLFFYAANLVESSVIPIQDVYFEHRVYLPMIGLILAFSQLFSELSKKLQISSKSYMIASLLIYLVFIQLTHLRAKEWQNPLLFHSLELNKSPNSTRAMSSYGKALAQNGDIKQALELIVKSYNLELEQGIVRQANLVSLLNILIENRYYQDALNLGKQALKLTENRPKLQSMVFAHLALVYYRMKICGFATGWSKKALNLDPSNEMASNIIKVCKSKHK